MGQIGSGALPVESVPSAGIAITPLDGSGSSLKRLAAAFRALPVPVIGHISEGALSLHLRCLEDVSGFIAQARTLNV